MDVYYIIEKRIYDLEEEAFSDFKFFSCLVRFYRALYYSHDFLNRHDVYFYDIILKAFRRILGSRRKSTLLYCIRRLFSDDLSRHFSLRSSFKELIDFLNPMFCMCFFKISS